jgi:PAS domain S-box-containing protein
MTTQKRSKKFWKILTDTLRGKKKLSKKTRSHLAGVAGIASVILTVLVFTRAHRETRIQFERATERTEAIEALLDSENFGYAIMDQEGRVIEWNPALERLTAWTEKEVREKGLSILMPPDIYLRHAKAVSKIMGMDYLQGKVAVVNCTIEPHDGGMQPLPVRITVRTVQSKSGKRFAIAHIDPARAVKELSLTN